MSDKIEYSRLLIKRATETGVTPTIPTGTTLSTFTNTDLFVGELFLNTTDENLWVRTDNGILQILNSGYTSSIFATGFTYDNANTLTISNNNGSSLSTSINTMTGLTVNGSFSATTLYGDGSNLTGINAGDIYVTGFTYDGANKLTIIPNSGATLNTYINTMTGLTVNGTLSGTTTIADQVGIGTTSPSYPLQVVGTNSTFYYDPTSAGGRFNVSGNTRLPRYDISIASYLTRPATGGSFAMRCWDDTLSPGYGKVGDMAIYAGNETNGLNLINGPGTNTEDYIRFYAGRAANTGTADIHIQGTGSTQGYVGINTETPTERLDVNGKTKTSQLQVTTSPTNGYVLTSDASGNATWQAPTPTFSGGSGNCITDLYTSNIIGCSPLSIYSDNSISGYTTAGSYTAKDVNSGGDRLKRTITKSSTGEISESDQQLDRLKFDVDNNAGNLYTSTQKIDYIEFNTYNDTSKDRGLFKYEDGVGIEISETKVDTGEFYKLSIDKVQNILEHNNNAGRASRLEQDFTQQRLITISGGSQSSVYTASENVNLDSTDGTNDSYIDILPTSVITEVTDGVTNTSNINTNPTHTAISSDNGTQNSYLDIQSNSIQSVTIDTASGNVGQLTIGQTSSQLTMTDGSNLNSSTNYVTPIQNTALVYEDSIASNVASTTLLNTSTDGSVVITAIGNTSVLSQDTLSLDPLNGSYLKSQSTTGVSYTELAFNDTDISIEANDGVDSRIINLVSTGITVTGGVIDYAADYSSFYTSRSIVDKGYVDSVVGGGSTFTGGTVTGDTNFTGSLSAKTITLDTTYTGTTGVGQITWNTDFGVPQVGMVGGNVVGKIGESVYAYVKNVDSTTLNKGEVVYIFGASGDKMSVKRASSTGDTTSSKTLGVVAESISVNGLGYIITQGTLDGLNLGSYTAGDILWLSPTPGQFTNVKSYAPNHLVFVGVVQRANAGNGQMYVKPQNGYELDELHNVAVTGATNGDLLIYNSGTTLWENSKTLTGNYTINGGLTITGDTTSGTISATTYNGDGKNLLGVGGGKGSFGITIDGGGSAITTGVKGYITVPYNGTITGWDIFGDTSGSIVVDVWKDTYANFPPTVADTIAGSEKPTLSTAVKNQDTNLSTWTTSVTTGDVVAFNVDSVSTVTRVNLIIYITKS